MHKLCICTFSSSVPITVQNTVQVPRRILTCEANVRVSELCRNRRRKAQLSSQNYVTFWTLHVDSGLSLRSSDVEESLKHLGQKSQSSLAVTIQLFELQWALK